MSMFANAVACLLCLIFAAFLWKMKGMLRVTLRCHDKLSLYGVCRGPCGSDDGKLSVPHGGAHVLRLYDGA